LEEASGQTMEDQDWWDLAKETYYTADVEIATFNQQTAPLGSELRAALALGSPQRAVNFAAPTASGGSSELSSPRVGVAFTPSCPLLDCTFDDNVSDIPLTSQHSIKHRFQTFCNYVTSVSEQKRANGSLREWSISARAVLNSLTGIPHDVSKTGSFLYAGGTVVSPNDAFILSTKLPVDLKEPARLDFFVYQAGPRLSYLAVGVALALPFVTGVKGRLQVCINTISNCALTIKGSTIDNKARRWKNFHVPVSATTHAVHFVADELQDNYVIGLDHIQLLNKYGMAAQPCK
uniref:Vanin_C domain-containing protein n=1 Tax=Heligmosomoides polygyrus TaxID=6339 RepID=A0A8L8JJG1_HELPZ